MQEAMTNTDVKQRISSLQQLPVLPHIAREILSTLDAGTVNWGELAAIAEFDESMMRQFHAASTEECRCPEGTSLEERLIALGLPRVVELTFKRVAPALFDGARSHGLDMKTFWSHAFSVARYADRIARKIESRFQPLAYVAGLLHDIGKPALDRVTPGGYTRALELVRQQGLYALEAERRELGADHTVAGKWLADAWGAPASVVSTIWLHHHPPGTLDATPYPIELIEIVSLANFLAHGDALESPPQERVASLDEQRYLRLGMERVDVLELLRDGTADVAPTESADTLPAETAVSTESRTESSRLRFERNYYESLCTLHERMLPGMAPATQLAVFVDGLRKAFAIPVGLCYLTDEASDTSVVLRWRSLEEEPESVYGKEGSGEADSANSLDTLIGTLEKSGVTAKDLTGPAHRHGFIALPLLDGNRSLGQLIFKGGTNSPNLSDSFLSDLMRFVKSAGAALARCRAVRGVYDEAESLAAAVWKQELSHRHDRRTERLISVGKMAAGAAHEINNPLAVISGKAQMMLSNTERAEDRKALEVIVEHSQRACGILRDLLQFARPNPPQLMPNRLSYLVKTSVDRVRQKLSEEGIQLVEEYAQDLPQIQVDRLQLDQVFQNLLKNAEQAMTRQGDKLTVRVRPNQDRTAVLVQIIDTGQGIAADIMDKVFEPFFTTQPGAEGTGMGLAVCHGIIEAHRGSITLHSQEGIGTTCTVALPIAADKGATSMDVPVARPVEAVAVGTRQGVSPAPRPERTELAPEVAAAMNDEAETRRRSAAADLSAPPAARAPMPEATPAPAAAPATPSFVAPEPASVAAHAPQFTAESAAHQSQVPPFDSAPETSGFASAEAPAWQPHPPAPSRQAGRPETSAAPGPAPTRPRPQNPGKTNGRILLVDDDPALGDVLTEALQKRGYAVCTASDGLEALAEVIANPVDLVLLDGAIPGVNTPQALVDEIQKRKPDLSVILLVGPTSTLEIGEAAGSGVRDILRKPFNMAQLLQVIETALAKRHVA